MSCRSDPQEGIHRFLRCIFRPSFNVTRSSQPLGNFHQPANTLPVWDRWWVIEEAIYDALFGASAAGFDSNGRVDLGSWLGTAVTISATSAKPEVDVNSISDDATAANNLELFTEGTALGTLPKVNTEQINAADVIGDGNATPWDGA